MCESSEGWTGIPSFLNPVSSVRAQRGCVRRIVYFQEFFQFTIPLCITKFNDSQLVNAKISGVSFNALSANKSKFKTNFRLAQPTYWTVSDCWSAVLKYRVRFPTGLLHPFFQHGCAFCQSHCFIELGKDELILWYSFQEQQVFNLTFDQIIAEHFWISRLLNGKSLG